MAYETHSVGLETGITHGQEFGLYQNYLKRILDMALVVIAALPVLMVIAVLAVIVSRDGNNPFFRQQRVGQDGRRFTMWKLRSMVPNADQALAHYLSRNPNAGQEWRQRQKLTNDPRITPVGHFIRRTSLDELPQLWNVLIGDMALIGPRPFTEDQTQMYPGTAYYAMRPGLSGYWQTATRNTSNFVDRAVFDTQYFYEQSLWTDVRLIWRTFAVVLRGTGT